MIKRFGTALNCIDGRTQIPVINWMKDNFNVDYVDLITEPGMDRVLSQDYVHESERLRDKVMVSIKAHNSNVVAVVGHYDCAGNPVSECEHYHDISVAVDRVKSWGLPIRVIGLWVDKSWKVHVVSK